MAASNVVEILVTAKNEATPGMAEASASAREVTAATKELSAAEQAEADAKAELEAKTAALAEVQEKEGATAKEVASAEAAVAAAQEKLTASSDTAAAASDRVTIAQARQADAAKTVADSQAAAAATVTAASKESAGASAAAGDAAVASGAKAEESGGLMAGMGSKVKMAGLGVAVGMGMAVKSAMDFQKQTTTLVTSAGESASQLGMLQQGILALSASTATSSDELSKGLYTISSAGITGASGLNVLKAAAQGAKAEGADLGEVTNALTSGINAYGMNVKTSAAATASSTSMMNQMLQTVAQGKMTFQELAGSLSAVLPIAAANGVSYAQVGGALATMTSMGVSARQGTQDLAATIRSLANPTGVATTEMSQLGLSSVSISQHLGKAGLTGTIQQLSDAVTSKMGPAGTVITNSMNQSKTAAADATTMLAQLPKSIQGIAKSYMDGKSSYTEFNTALKGSSMQAREMGGQFAAVAAKSQGFNNLLASGAPVAQTYAAAMSKMLGGATGLSVGLMLTGAHAKTFQDNVTAIGAKANGASGQVAGFSEVTKETSFQAAKAGDSIKAAGTSLGLSLLPAVNAILTPLASFFGMIAQNHAAAIAFAIVVGGLLAGAIGTKAVHALTDMKDAMKSVASGMESLVGKIRGTSSASDAQAAASKKAGDAAKTAGAEQEKASASSAAAAEKSAATQEAAQAEVAESAEESAGEVAAANEEAAEESADSYKWMAAQAKPSFTAVSESAEESAGEVATANEEAATESSGSWIAAAARQVAAGASWVAQSVAKVAGVVASNVAGAASAAASWVAGAAAQVASGIAWVATSIAKVAVVVGANLAGAAATAAAWLVANAVMLLGIGLIVAAVVIAVVEIVKHWKSIVHGVEEAFDDVKKAVSTAVSAVVDFVKAHWQLLLAILLGPIAVAVLEIAKHWDTIKSDASKFASDVTSTISKFGSDVLKFFERMFDDVTSAERRGISVIMADVKKWFDDFVSTEERGLANIVSWFEGLPGRIISAISSLAGMLEKAGENAITGLLNGMKSMITGALGTVEGWGHDLANALGAPFGIHFSEPSEATQMIKAGRNIPAALVKGITSGAPAVRSAMAGLAGSAAASSAGSLAIASGAVGGANAKVAFDFSGSTQDKFTQAIRQAVRVIGGGDVQKAFGSR